MMRTIRRYLEDDEGFVEVGLCEEMEEEADVYKNV
jgi:hypothetical protein